MISAAHRIIDRLLQGLGSAARHNAVTPHSLDAAQLEDRVLFSAAPVPTEPMLDAGADDHFTSTALDSETDGRSSSTDFVTHNTGTVPAEVRRELVFVDADADNYQQLVDDLLNNQDDSRDIEVVLLDADRDGIEQITQALAGYDGLDAVHIVSHGTDGHVKLGSTWLSANNLAEYAGDIAGWNDALRDGADLLIYGCDLAATEAGQALTAALGELTSTDVAASDDDTGHAQLGGNWEFEYQVGSIETGVAFTGSLQHSWFNVLAANLAPVNSVLGAQSTGEDTPLVFSAGNGNQISISDPDAGGSSVEVTLSVDQGVLQLNGTTGLVFSDGDGVADPSMTFTGTLADINTALNGLQYTPNAGYAGPDLLQITTNDLGNSGTGGPQFDYDQVDITVNPDGFNDKPVNTVPGTQTTVEETPLFFSDVLSNRITISDDSALGQVEVTLTVTDGTISLGTIKGSESPINVNTGNSQYEPVVASDAAGNYVVVWTSAGQDNPDGFEGVYARLYNADGTPRGVEFQINQTTLWDQHHPTVAMNDTGEFVVAWTSDNQDNPDLSDGVYVRAFDSTGAALTGELRANTETLNNQFDPAVAINNAGQFVVTWTSKSQDGSQDGVYAQRFDAAGTPLGIEFRVNTETNFDQNGPSIAMDDAGNFVVVWTSRGQDGNLEGIFAQRYDQFGNTDGGEFQVNTGWDKIQSTADVAMTSTGEFVVVWQSKHQDGSQFGIYGQRYDQLGNTVGGEFQVHTTPTGNQTDSTVAIDDSGEFVVLWTVSADASGLGVYGQRFDAAGNRLGVEFQVNSESIGHQQAADVAIQPGGDFVAVWQSQNQDGSGQGVYSQRFGDPTGLTFTTGDGTDDTTMVFRGTLADVNEALNGLVFTPTLDFVGTATLDIDVNDLGNSGGSAKSDIDQVQINVTGVNDAPVNNVPGPQTTGVDTPLVFNAAGGNLISITDVDAAGNDTFKVTLSSANGTVTLSTTNGLTFLAGADGTSFMTITGTLNKINTALDGLQFDPTTAFSGLAGITIDTNDQGNTGAGGSQTDIDTVDITVGGVGNNVPTATNMTQVKAYVEGAASVALDDIVVTDVDAGALITATLTLSNIATGTLTAASGSGETYDPGPGIWTITASEILVNTALAAVAFVPNTDNDVDTLVTTHVEDQFATGPADGTITLDVTPMNDPPDAVADGGAAFTTDEDTSFTTGDVVTNDSDPDTGDSYWVIGINTTGTQGTVVDNGDGTFDYDPAGAFEYLDVGEVASDAFTYTLRDVAGATDTATVTITINGAEDAPVIGGTNTGSVTEDVTLTAGGTLTITDADTSDNPINWSDELPTLGDNGYGDFEITSNNWTYTLNNTHPSVQALGATATLTDTHTFVASDGSTQVVTITINGTNDAPQITGGPDAAGLTETDAGLTTSGTLTVSDVDLTDLVTTAVDSVGVGGTGAPSVPPTLTNPILLSFLTVAPTAILDGTETTDTLTWDFDSGTEAFDFLATGETLVLTYTVSATDDDGTPLNDTETVTITITGSNDAPTITVVDVAGAVTEDAATPNLTDSGSVTFAEVDDTDVISSSVALTSTATTGPAIPAGLTAALGTAVSLTQTGTNDGTIDWDFTVANSLVQYLADGETVTATYTITVLDDSGTANDTATQDVTVVITGTNDAPTITVVDVTGALTEDATTPNLTDSGSVTFAEVDETDVISSSVALTSTATTGPAIPAGLTAALGTAVSLTQTGTNDGTIDWDFTVANSLVQYLADGETVTATYTITVLDDSGTANDTATQDVTVVITGTNDVPTITVVDVNGAVTEDATTPNLTDGGSVTFAEVDDTDVISSSVALTSTATTGPAIPAGLSAALGTAVSLTQTGTNDGTIDWDFTVANSLVQYLADGETITATYTITVTDDSGTANDTATQDVTVVITGTNDVPTITVVDVTGAVTEDATTPNLTDSGSVTFAEVDDTDVISSSVALTSTATTGPAIPAGLTAALGTAVSLTQTGTNDGTIDWDFTVANSLVQYLANGETVTATYTITVTDDSGTANDTATQDVTVVITGTNDVPSITVVDVTGAVSEDATTPNLTDSGSVTFAEADDTDVISSSVALTSTATTGPAIPAGLSAALSTAVSLTQTGTNDGTIDWDFTVANSLAQYLADGETVTATYTITVTDDSGTANDTATQDVTVVITGTNDVPTITVVDATGAVTEDATTPNLTDSGSVTFAEVDDTDVISSSVTLTSTATTRPAIPAGLTAALTTAVSLTQTGTNDGTIDWDFTVANSLVQYLADGETVTATYTITVTDDSGTASDTATQDVTITITGTNDDPVATANTNAIAEDAVLPISGNVIVDNDGFGTDSDLDTSDTLSVSQVDTETDPAINVVGLYGTLDWAADGSYSYTVDTLNPSVIALGAGDSLTDTFTYTLFDGTTTDTATLTITINGSNDAPVATDNTNTIAEDAFVPVAGNVITDDDTFGVDSDPEGDSLSVSQIDGVTDPAMDVAGSYGSLDWDTGGSYSYTVDNGNASVQARAVGEMLTDTFTYTLYDGGATDTATLTITITGTNDDPVAADNTNTIAEDAVAAVSGNVISDDDGFGTDSDTDTSDTLTVSQFDTETDPAIDVVGLYGTLDWDTDGSYSYSVDNGNATVQALAVGETLTETFTYTLYDGITTDTATLTITITGTNDDPVATDNANTIAEDAVAPTGGNVMSDDDGFGVDSDTDTSDVLAVLQIDGETDATVDIVGLYGTLDWDAGGNYSYSVDNGNAAVQALGVGQSLTDTFTYTVFDGVGTDTATLTITINGANDDPTAADDLGFTNEDTVLNVAASGVLANDNDTDASDSRTVTEVNGSAANVGTPIVLVSGATLTLNANGSYDYDPNGAFEYLAVSETTTDTFTYKISDTNGGTDTATVTITIDGRNDLPTANNDSGGGFNTDEDSSFVTANVLGNDTDPDTSDVLSVVGLNTAGTLGTVTDNGNGTFTYDPAGAFDYLEAGQTATDTFSYTVDDGNSGTDTAAVTIRIDGANDAPVAGPDAAGVNEGGTVNIDLTGNDTDADDGIDPASISIVSGPSNGTLVINTDGTVDYTHNGSETTTDSFTYRIRDLAGTNSTPAVVDITINPQNDPPVAGDDAYTTKNDTTLTLTVADGVQANDNDAENDPLNTTVVAGPANGTLTLNADGSFTYAPDAGFIGTDSFTYKANDGTVDSNTATVTIEVQLDTPPPTVDTDPDPDPEPEEEEEEPTLEPTPDPPSDDPEPPPSITPPSEPPVEVHADEGAPRVIIVDETEEEEVDVSKLLRDFGRPDIRDPRFVTPPPQLLKTFSQFTEGITLDGAYEFFEQLDSLEDLMNSQTVIANVTAGSAGVISLGLSAGYAFVTIRAGTLVTSLLTSMPAWRVVDPLPVLAYLNDEDDDDLDAAEKNETLESIVAGAGIEA